MRITYKLEKEDYFKFNLNHMTKFPKINRSMKIQRFFMPIVFTVLALILVYKVNYSSKIVIPIYIVACLGWILYFPKMLEKSIHKRLERVFMEEENKFLLDERVLEVKDDGIYEIIKDKKGQEKSIFASDEVVEIEETNDSLYIYLSSESVYLIPLKFFKNEEEKQEFLSKVNKFNIS